MTNTIFWLAPLGSASALFFAWFFYRSMKKESEGTEHMARIASYVRKGAMAYLKQQYKVVSMIFACLVVPEQRAFLETTAPAGTMIVAQD